MEDKKVLFSALESVSAMAERTITRLWLAVILLVVVLLVNNIAWLCYLNQYDIESYAVTADGSSNANYIGRDGDITNGGIGEGEKEDKEERQIKGENDEKDGQAGEKS